MHWCSDVAAAAAVPWWTDVAAVHLWSDVAAAIVPRQIELMAWVHHSTAHTAGMPGWRKRTWAGILKKNGSGELGLLGRSGVLWPLGHLI